ncbi:hypothetical protein ACEN2J_20380 [Pseudorhodobacter sp. W20_MBD10_FR17]|uniref:hypothetical protein n=1 Tax=Pseudorhodobacter sp. W20_MBD10_FR17 TaxID=3240266 RepID=UPI003F9C0E12
MLHNTLSVAPTLPNRSSHARRDALLAFHLDQLQSHGPRRPVTLPSLTGLRGR